MKKKKTKNKQASTIQIGKPHSVMSYKMQFEQLSSFINTLKSHLKIRFLILLRDGRVLILPDSLFRNVGPRQKPSIPLFRLDAHEAFTRASYRAFWSCIGRLRPQHEQQSKFSCQSIVHYFTSRFSISEQHFSEKCFNSLLVCLATLRGLRLSIEHLRHYKTVVARQCLYVPNGFGAYRRPIRTKSIWRVQDTN